MKGNIITSNKYDEFGRVITAVVEDFETVMIKETAMIKKLQRLKKSVANANIQQ